MQGVSNQNFSLPKPNSAEQAYTKATKSLVTAENNYLKAMETGDQVKIAKAENKMKAAARVFQSATRVADMMHQLLMSAIRNIRA